MCGYGTLHALIRLAIGRFYIKSYWSNHLSCSNCYFFPSLLLFKLYFMYFRKFQINPSYIIHQPRYIHGRHLPRTNHYSFVCRTTFHGSCAFDISFTVWCDVGDSQSWSWFFGWLLVWYQWKKGKIIILSLKNHLIFI